MSQYQKDYYQTVFDVWGHAYQHHEDGHLLMVYQGKRPMDCEWEEAETTNRQLWQLLRDAQSQTQDLHNELACARARIWELERAARPTSPTPVRTR